MSESGGSVSGGGGGRGSAWDVTRDTGAGGGSGAAAGGGGHGAGPLGEASVAVDRLVAAVSLLPEPQQRTLVERLTTGLGLSSVSLSRGAAAGHGVGAGDGVAGGDEVRDGAGMGGGATLSMDEAAERTGGGVGRGRGEELGPGSRIGPYRLLERLGEGGFGEVFLAEQSEPVRRRVALKLLKRGMDSEQVVARFEAERQALALMDHPSIARVLDAGPTQSGRPFFVMEYVRGRQLVEFCDQAKMTVAERVALFRQVCLAVQHAHQKGIIHRDLKPSNILVTMVDGRAVPKVIDFGVAKATHAPLMGEQVYTGVHQIVGTPMYMSPEQAGTTGMDIDTRSDVYALGAVLYELLCGLTTLSRDRLRQMSLAEVQRAIAEEVPLKPSAQLGSRGEAEVGQIAASRGVEAGKLVRLLRGDLDWVVMKCLEKDRSRRYGSAAALEEDLGRHVRLEAVSAGPPSFGYLARKFVRRYRVQVVAGAGALAMLVGGLGVSMVSWARTAEQSARLRATLDFFSGALAGSSADGSVVGLWNDAPELTLGKALMGAAERIEESFVEEPELEAEIRELIGLAQLRGSEFEEAASQLSRAAEIRSAVLGAGDARTLELLLPLADALGKAGRAAEATEAGRRAYEASRAAEGEGSARTRASALWLARWLSAQYRYSEAAELFTAAMVRSQGVPDLQDAITVAAFIEQSQAYIGEGKLDVAERELRRAAERVSGLAAPSGDLAARCERLLGQVLLMRGKHGDAVALLSRDRDAAEWLRTDRVRSRLIALSLGLKGERERSEAMFTELLAMEERAPGPVFREIFARLYYAEALLAWGRAGEAVAQARRAIERYDSANLPDDPERLHAKALLARALVENGEASAAEPYLAEASKLFENYPEHRLFVPFTKLARGRQLQALGDREGAGAELREAERVALSIFGPQHAIVAEIRESLRK